MQLNDVVLSYKEEMVSQLCKLISMPSLEAPPLPGQPENLARLIVCRRQLFLIASLRLRRLAPVGGRLIGRCLYGGGPGVQDPVYRLEEELLHQQEKHQDIDDVP